MLSDFYLKAQTLYEEFQKKELHYLNAERKLNDSLMWKKNLNVPLQEYLDKIHQREKKNEETYQSIMKQMTELDQHTDLLCTKIEKLGIFRNIQVDRNLNDTNYPLSSKYIPQTLYTVQNFNTETAVSQFERNSLKSVSTQTEANVYCDNCKSIIQASCEIGQMRNSASSFIDILSVSTNEPAVSSQMCQTQNFTSSFIDVLSVSNNKLKIMDSSRIQNDSLSNKNDNDSQFIASALNAKHFSSQIYDNKKNFKNGLQIADNIECSKCPNNGTMLEGKVPSLQFNEVLVTRNAEKKSESKGLLIESQSKSNDSEINVEVAVSKNDTDSVNHEFDFLESDTIHISSKIKHQNNSKNNMIPQSDIAKNVDDAANSDVRLSNKTSLKHGNKKDCFQSNKEGEISDNKSATSESISGTRSPAMSLSDSDSISEKGSFTASAAYQSLLGNIAIPSKINQQVSETESEDEVEKTLAHSVQKSNIKTKSSVPSNKDKSALQFADSRSIANRPKPVSMNKPQSKLSKSTKKVLGIDSSSSSEIEAAVKPSESKKDEDSDEFDFYD